MLRLTGISAAILLTLLISPNALGLSPTTVRQHTQGWDKDGLDQLRQCVDIGGPAAAPCITGLVRRRDAVSARRVRSLLRRTEHPEVVEAAALALAAWNDRFSQSLLSRLLWEGRGGLRGMVAVTHALGRLESKKGALFRQFAAYVHDHGLVRAMVSHHHASPRYRTFSVVQKTQLATLVLKSLLLNQPSKTDRRHAQIALHAIGQAGKGACRYFWRALSHVKLTETQLPRLLDYAPLLPSRCLALGRQNPDVGISVVTKVASQLPRRNTPLLLRSACTFGQHTGDCSDTLDPYAALADGPHPQLPKRHYDEPAETPPFEISDSLFQFNPNFAQPDWYPRGLHITIDDGPRYHRLPSILSVLNRYGVKATFFWCGSSLVKTVMMYGPARARKLINRVIKSGHEVAYHSMTHATQFKHHLIAWDHDQRVDDVQAFRWLLNHVAGKAVSIRYGRLPGGSGTYRKDLQKSLAAAGLHAPALWDPQSPNYGGGREAARAYHKRCKPYVVLLHERADAPKELTRLLNGLRLHADLGPCKTFKSRPQPRKRSDKFKPWEPPEGGQ